MHLCLFLSFSLSHLTLSFPISLFFSLLFSFTFALFLSTSLPTHFFSLSPYFPPSVYSPLSPFPCISLSSAFSTPLSSLQTHQRRLADENNENTANRGGLIVSRDNKTLISGRRERGVRDAWFSFHRTSECGAGYERGAESGRKLVVARRASPSEFNPSNSFLPLKNAAFSFLYSALSSSIFPVLSLDGITEILSYHRYATRS